MGKSVAADFLRGFGLPVVDTDQLARDLVLPGQPALAEIRSVFGDGVTGADGELRRDVLAGIVFGDDARRQRLEHILHPRIRAAWSEQVRAWETAGERAGVVVIPLLFETGAETAFTATICVACSAASQAERLAARGWSAGEAERRIRAQWPTERKLASAEFVVWAEGGLDQTRQQLERILRTLGLAQPP
jgi:dephospho-CoA kinase